MCINKIDDTNCNKDLRRKRKSQRHVLDVIKCCCHVEHVSSHQVDYVLSARLFAALVSVIVRCIVDVVRDYAQCHP